MKLLIVVSLFVLNSAVYACTDFTGQYQTAVQTYYSISQNGCESMEVIDESGTNTMVFDGVERLIYDYDIEVEGQVIAHISIYLSSKMVGEKWVYYEKDVYTYTDGETEVENKWAEVSFNEETDLLTVLHKEDGSIETFVDVRYKDKHFFKPIQ